MFPHTHIRRWMYLRTNVSSCRWVSGRMCPQKDVPQSDMFAEKNFSAALTLDPNPTQSHVLQRQLPIDPLNLDSGWCLSASWVFAGHHNNIDNVFWDRSAQAFRRAATLSRQLLVKLAISPRHSIQTPGQLDLALTPKK